jgi:hypothetical protein
MVPQPDRPPPLVTSKKPDAGRPQSVDREEDVMLSADAGVSSASIMRRCGVSRRFE